MRSPKPRSRKKLILITALLLILAGGGAYAWLSRAEDKPTASTEAPKTTGKDGSTKLAPATEEEKKETDAYKAELGKNEDTPATPSSASSSVTPTITYAGQYDSSVEAAAFVSGIYEDGGTCTLTLTKGSTSVTRQTAASKDATVTRCVNFAIPRSEIPSNGEWTVSVSYKSATHSGTSATQKITIK
jgi:hypothetical protein